MVPAATYPQQQHHQKIYEFRQVQHGIAATAAVLWRSEQKELSPVVRNDAVNGSGFLSPEIQVESLLSLPLPFLITTDLLFWLPTHTPHSSQQHTYYEAYTHAHLKYGTDMNLKFAENPQRKHLWLLQLFTL